MREQIETETRSKMDHAIAAMEHDFGTLRTGRASTAVFDSLEVDAYGTMSPLKQVASVNTPDARSITIQPWDKNLIGPIEKSILAANLGLTPTNDGKLIRITVPQLTEQRRKDLVKSAKAMAENGRVAIRNVRRHANDEIKKAEKNGEMSENERDTLLAHIQTITDKEIEEINKQVEKKEKEIMEI